MTRNFFVGIYFFFVGAAKENSSITISNLTAYIFFFAVSFQNVAA
jgi:hypothetical protein